MTLFFAMLLGYKVPLLPVQLLFVNLVTDSFPALCLGMEPPEPDVMSSPGKSRHHAIFSFSSLFEIIHPGHVSWFSGTDSVPYRRLHHVFCRFISVPVSPLFQSAEPSLAA